MHNINKSWDCFSWFLILFQSKHCPVAPLVLRLHEVGPGLPVREQGTSVLVVHTLHQRELDVGIVELLDVRTTALARLHGLNLDDLQRRKNES